MKWLNYHHLLYFQQIAREGSIVKAAEKLGVGQPALSAQLKMLEDYFSAKLFERKKRRLFLTQAGSVALEYADSIFEKGHELIEIMEKKSFSKIAHLYIGALDGIPKKLIVELTKAAREEGDCRVHIREGSGEDLLKDLSSHRLDLVLTNYSAPVTEGGSVFSKSLGSVPVAVYGARSFMALKKGFPNSLGGQPLLAPSFHSKLRSDLDHYFVLNKVFPNVVSEVQDTSVQKLLAIDGVGLLPIPEFPVRELVKEKKLYKIGELQGCREEYFLLSSQRIVENPVASRLVRQFKYNF